MSRGENVGLIPGGFQEASLYQRGKHRAVLKRKTGFIKYALQFGYSVAPVYVFGEEKTMWTLNVFPKRLAMWLNRSGHRVTVCHKSCMPPFLSSFHYLTHGESCSVLILYLISMCHRFNVPATVFFGKYFLLPDDALDLAVVVGAPLALPHISSPTPEDVSKYHDEYVAALRSLFDRHKEACGAAGEELEVL